MDLEYPAPNQDKAGKSRQDIEGPDEEFFEFIPAAEEIIRYVDYHKGQVWMNEKIPYRLASFVQKPYRKDLNQGENNHKDQTVCPVFF